MAAISAAKTVFSAFNNEKPHSSITQWIDIVTSNNYEDEAYDGIPEIVDSINLQPTGPAEASRAIRKKIKHGTVHNQYRALVILKALVENGGSRFQKSFADSQLTDALKHLATDPSTDPKVKKKLLSVLASWNQQFKDEPSMSFVAGLYKQVKPERPRSVDHNHIAQMEAERRKREEDYERKRREEKEAKESAKRRAKEEKEAERRKKEEDARRAKARASRKPFIFEQEKPKILESIATASQASSNLVNAITLVNTANDSLQANERVQDCLAKAKQSRKIIVRYIQLVENEDLIGTLIEVNERIIAAMEMYDTLSKPVVTEKDVDDVQAGLAKANIHESEVSKLQEKQRAAVQRAVKSGSVRGKQREDPYAYEGRGSSSAHPDLQDLSFGAIGDEQSHLPPPMRPNARSDDEGYDSYHRGSLSDFSDYESSDEEAHSRRASGSRRDYVNVSDDDEPRSQPKKGLLEEEDPFADPFRDPEDEGTTPGVEPTHGMKW